MNRRIVINLVAFGTLGVVMVIWALQNVVTFSFLSRPYHVNAYFVASPGLHPGFEVDYLGVPVGKIGSVRLEKDQVRVRLDIDRGQRLPAGLTAAAARKSAVGEPYVALTPRPGAADGPALKPGSTIPVTDTTVPPAYGDLFAAVNKALSAINPDDARTLVHELYLGWNGRADSLRQIIQGGDQITSTFAENSRLIDGLTESLTRITHVLAQNRGALGAGIDNLAELAQALVQVKAELAQLRDKGPGLLNEVDDLLAATRPEVRCAVTSLSQTLPGFATPAHLNDLTRTLTLATPLINMLKNVVRVVGGQYVLNVLFIVTFQHQATLEYKYPLPQPAVGAIPACADGHTPGVTQQIGYQGKDPNSVTPPQYRPPATGGGSSAAVRNTSNQGPAGPPRWLVYVPPVIALLVLIKFAVGAVPVLKSRRRDRS